MVRCLSFSDDFQNNSEKINSCPFAQVSKTFKNCLRFEGREAFPNVCRTRKQKKPCKSVSFPILRTFLTWFLNFMKGKRATIIKVHYIISFLTVRKKRLSLAARCFCMCSSTSCSAMSGGTPPDMEGVKNAECSGSSKEGSWDKHLAYEQSLETLHSPQSDVTWSAEAQQKSCG